MQNSDGAVAVEVSKRLLRLWPWLAAIAGGLLGAAALPPLDQTWLIWIALVPLCATILFSGEKYQAPLVARSPPRIRRWPDILLELLFWMTTVTALRLVRPAILSGPLFRSLGLVLRTDATAASQIVARDKWSEMLARAKPEPLPASSPWLRSGHSFFLALCLTSGMGRAGMDTRLVDVRLRLEWARHRAAWNVAADSDRGIYRSRRGNFPGRVLQRHPYHNSASDLGGKHVVAQCGHILI